MMTASLLWIMCGAIVLALAGWLVAVAFAQRKPTFEHPHAEPRRGQVQGGTHVGGGRSVSPRRDAEVVPDENPEKPTVPVREERGTSPMDL
jgi:hypothetical protein